MGYDTAVRLFEPRFYDNMQHVLATQLFASAAVAVFNRENITAADMEVFVNTNPEVHAFKDGIHLLTASDPSWLDTSSSQVRRTVQNPESAPPAELLDRRIPQSTAEYIAQHHLYKQAD
eukprot:c15357_g1_i1.p2 GENE.c15357_g1_i1~~c15357_g1_i1.p2  ORF type:complete len:119 (-),score=28.06 c15357_g1_i1:52-408(-)